MRFYSAPVRPYGVLISPLTMLGGFTVGAREP